MIIVCQFLPIKKTAVTGWAYWYMLPKMRSFFPWKSVSSMTSFCPRARASRKKRYGINTFISSSRGTACRGSSNSSSLSSELKQTCTTDGQLRPSFIHDKCIFIHLSPMINVPESQFTGQNNLIPIISTLNSTSHSHTSQCNSPTPRDLWTG